MGITKGYLQTQMQPLNVFNFSICNRLRPPEAIEPWNGIFEADRHQSCDMERGETETLVTSAELRVLHLAPPASPGHVAEH